MDNLKVKSVSIQPYSHNFFNGFFDQGIESKESYFS